MAVPVSVARSDCGNFLWLHSDSGWHHQPAHIGKCEQGLGQSSLTLNLKMHRQRSVERLSVLSSPACDQVLYCTVDVDDTLLDSMVEETIDP